MGEHGDHRVRTAAVMGFASISDVAACANAAEVFVAITNRFTHKDKMVRLAALKSLQVMGLKRGRSCGQNQDMKLNLRHSDIDAIMLCTQDSSKKVRAAADVLLEDLGIMNPNRKHSQMRCLPL